MLAYERIVANKAAVSWTFRGHRVRTPVSTTAVLMTRFLWVFALSQGGQRSQQNAHWVWSSPDSSVCTSYNRTLFTVRHPPSLLMMQLQPLSHLLHPVVYVTAMHISPSQNNL
jgi:hypothetical protein